MGAFARFAPGPESSPRSNAMMSPRAAACVRAIVKSPDCSSIIRGSDMIARLFVIEMDGFRRSISPVSFPISFKTSTSRPDNAANVKADCASALAVIAPIRTLRRMPR